MKRRCKKLSDLTMDINMKRRRKMLLDLTRDIISYDEGWFRLRVILTMWYGGIITMDLYRFLKRKIIQNAYLNGVTTFDYMIEVYFSNNDICSFNHYVIKNKR